MMNLYGENLLRSDLQKRVGDMSQIAGLRSSNRTDGTEKGVSSIDFYTGTGFTFTVLPDRGLDISTASYRGIPLCWRSSTGDVAPTFYEPSGNGWLRSFYGGLLTTCGMTNVGPANKDEGEPLGLHDGRASGGFQRAPRAGRRPQESRPRIHWSHCQRPPPHRMAS